MKNSGKLVVSNKRAFHDFSIQDTWEAGMVLQGIEVKAVRQGSISIAEGWIKLKGNAAYLVGATVSPEKVAPWIKFNPTRERKLLLNKHELNKIKTQIQRGFSVIPLRLYFSDRGYAKLEIATAKGRKKHDKRQRIKDRDVERFGD